MKKLPLILVAVVMGFILTSCNGTSTKDAIMKDVDNYFTELEQKLGEISNAEDFLSFVEAASDRSDLVNLLQEKYGDKTISDKDNETVQNFMYERATAYNHVEAEKAAEYLTPLIDQYESVINAMYDIFTSDGDSETFQALTEEFKEAEAALIPFTEYDNVRPDLQERIQAAAAKLYEMLSALE